MSRFSKAQDDSTQEQLYRARSQDLKKKPLQMNSEVIKTMFGNGFKKYSRFKTKNTFFLKHLQEIHFSKHNTLFTNFFFSEKFSHLITY